MTTRERWLAALTMQPVDRLPFWAKLAGPNCAHHVGHEAAGDLAQFHAWVGSEPPDGVGPCVRERRSRTRIEAAQRGPERRTTYHAPNGDLLMIERYDSPSQSWHPMKFPVETADDIPLMAACYEDLRVEPDREAAQKARQRMAEIGERAVVLAGIGETPLMHWVEWVAGVANAHLLLSEHREAVEALFAAMQRALVQRARAMAECCPADVFVLVENTSTTLISPEQYRRYCVPHVREIAALAGAAGRLVMLHMCGHLKALLPDLAALPVHSFEAFTSPPVGNTRLADGRAGCPDVCLVGGTNAALWLRPAHEIIADLERDLAALPHHRGLVPSSAGMMPPACSPETIRAVANWVHGCGA